MHRTAPATAALTTAALTTALALVGAPAAPASAPGGPPPAGDLAPVTPGVLPGFTNSGARDVNDRDQVAGWSYRLEPTARARAWRWSDGRLTDLGALAGPGADTFARGINDRGQVVGSTSMPGGPPGSTVGFLWQDGRMEVLGTFEEPFYPAAVDDRGRVVGFGGPGGLRAAIWQDGTVTTLPAPAGCALTSAEALNERGTVVGTCYPTTGERYSLLWRGAGRSVHALEVSMEVLDVDDRGWLAGRDKTTGRATLWAPQRRGGWRAIDLGVEQSWARAFARPGEVALTGFVDSGAGTRRHALLWRRGGLTVLPGGQDYEAVAANRRGHVVGSTPGLPPLLWQRVPSPR